MHSSIIFGLSPNNAAISRGREKKMFREKQDLVFCLPGLAISIGNYVFKDQED